MIKQVMILMLTAGLCISAVVPIFAQTTTNQGEDILPIRIMVTGPLAYEDVTDNPGFEVLVAGIVVIPMAGFDASANPAGKNLTVIGDLTADDEIKALSMFDATQEPTEIEPAPIPTSAPVVEDDDDDGEVITAPGQGRGRNNGQGRGQGRGQGNNNDMVEISGRISSISSNAIVVDDVEIEGGNVFRPARMEMGQEVTVIGTYKNNGRLRTISIEIEGDSNDDVLVDQEDEFVPCIPDTNMIAHILANEFDQELMDILEMYCDGNNFGDVARALLLSNATGQEPTLYLEQFNNGADWLTIINDAGYEPWDIAPDHVLRLNASPSS